MKILESPENQPRFKIMKSCVPPDGATGLSAVGALAVPAASRRLFSFFRWPRKQTALKRSKKKIITLAIVVGLLLAYVLSSGPAILIYYGSDYRPIPAHRVIDLFYWPLSWMAGYKTPVAGVLISYWSIWMEHGHVDLCPFAAYHITFSGH
jgi:hypothetical protein